jgi:hypothetical protein
MPVKKHPAPVGRFGGKDRPAYCVLSLSGGAFVHRSPPTNINRLTEKPNRRRSSNSCLEDHLNSCPPPATMQNKVQYIMSQPRLLITYVWFATLVSPDRE